MKIGKARKLRDEKAVSPVIGVILMVAITGFFLSIAVMALTVYFMQRPDIIVKETNPVLNYIFSSVNDYYLVLFFGLLWGVALTAYWKIRETWAGVYCSFYIFSLFMFNFIHDITVVMLK